MILRETQNQNDADDANDAESGIWYRDVLKTASQASSASSASLSSQGDCRGSGVHPRNVHVDIHMLCLQNMFPPKAGAIKSDTHINLYKFQSESV